jgi:hypothetical protein
VIFPVQDADALDRWRIGDLNPSLLRTQAARSLLDASYRLWHETCECYDGLTAFDEVVHAAIHLGVVAR